MGFSKEYPKDFTANFGFSLTSAYEGKIGAILLGEKLLKESYEEETVLTFYSDKHRINDSRLTNVSYGATLKDIQEISSNCKILSIDFSCRENIENEYQNYWNYKILVFVLTFSYERSRLKNRIEQLKIELFNINEAETRDNNAFYCKKYNNAVEFYSHSNNFNVVWDWIVPFVRYHEKGIFIPLTDYLDYDRWKSGVYVREKYLAIWYLDRFNNSSSFVFSDFGIADLENLDYATGLLIAIGIKLSEYFESHPTYSLRWKIANDSNSDYKNELLLKLKEKNTNDSPKQSW